MCRQFEDHSNKLQRIITVSYCSCLLIISSCIKFVVYSIIQEKRGHVFLVLGKDLHQFPWESMKILRPHSVSRIPSIDILQHMLQMKRNQSGYTEADLNKVAYVVNPKVSSYVVYFYQIVVSFVLHIASVWADRICTTLFLNKLILVMPV